MFSLSIIKNILEDFSPNLISNCTVNYENSLLLTDTCNNIYEYNNQFSFEVMKIYLFIPIRLN